MNIRKNLICVCIVLLPALLTILSSCASEPGKSDSGSSSSSSGGSPVSFSDTFDRDNSPTVGTGWTEIENYGGTASVSGHSLLLSAGHNGTYAYLGGISKTIGTYSENISFFLKYTPSTAKAVCSMSILRSSDSKVYTGYATDNLIRLSSSAGQLTNTNFLLTAGATYDLVFSKNGSSLSLAITNTTNTLNNACVTTSDNTFSNFDSIAVLGGWNDGASTSTITIDDLYFKSL